MVIMVNADNEYYLRDNTLLSSGPYNQLTKKGFSVYDQRHYQKLSHSKKIEILNFPLHMENLTVPILLNLWICKNKNTVFLVELLKYR